MSYRMSLRSEKDFGEVALGCLGLLTLIVILTVVSAFVVTLVWGWIVPQVFAGSVEQGVLPTTLTIIQAFKLSILFSILGLTSAVSSSSKSKKESSSGSSGCGESITVALITFVILLPIWATVVVVSGFLVSLVWGWVVPDVFSGAVAHGLIPAQLQLWHAIMLSILFSVLGLSKR